MEWEELKEKVYYCDGSLRDIYIHNTSKDGWKIWSDFVNKHYKNSHHFFETDTNENKIDINKVAGYWNGIVDYCSTAHIYLNGIEVNAHFFDENEIENDLNPAEFNSYQDHQKLMNYLCGLSKVKRGLSRINMAVEQFLVWLNRQNICAISS